MTKITILSGFGQEPQTFKNVFNNKDVIALDYLQNKNFEDLLTSDLKAYDNEVVIGWSLGGQVAIRLIEKQKLKPKLLILIATPFQFVEDDKNEVGMPLELFNQFQYVLNDKPKHALGYLEHLTSLQDKNPEDVLKNMVAIENTDNLNSWLQELKDFNCFNVDFKNFPKTVYICGDGDAVVNSKQYEYFNKRLGDFEMRIIFSCGHAPHFSHKNEFLNIINEKI
jgi:pimeloyl-ACP methyl ester carboxylesterase